LKPLIAVTLLFSTLLITMPVSAAELATSRTSVGSVSGVGPVSLRGISIPQEGTLFDGDILQVGYKGYAKVTLVAGHRLELDANTQISVHQSATNVVIRVNSGNVAFIRTGTSVLMLQIGPYEIIPESNAAGSVALIGKEALGLRGMRGKMAVRQTTLRTSSIVTEGQERILTFTGQSSAPLAQIASTAPSPIPAIPPAPQGASPPGRGLSTGGWIAILATVGGAAAAIAVLATRGDNDEENSAILFRQRTVQGTQAAVTAAQQASTTAQQVQTAANTVNAALAGLTNATVRANLQNQTQTISSQVTAAQTQLATFTTTLNGLLGQLQSATSNSQIASLVDQINGVIRQINGQISIINADITQLQAIVASANQNGLNIAPIVIQPAPTVLTVFASPT